MRASDPARTWRGAGRARAARVARTVGRLEDGRQGVDVGDEVHHRAERVVQGHPPALLRRVAPARLLARQGAPERLSRPPGRPLPGATAHRDDGLACEGGGDVHRSLQSDFLCIESSASSRGSRVVPANSGVGGCAHRERPPRTRRVRMREKRTRIRANRMTSRGCDLDRRFSSHRTRHAAHAGGGRQRARKNLQHRKLPRIRWSFGNAKERRSDRRPSMNRETWRI